MRIIERQQMAEQIASDQRFDGGSDAYLKSAFHFKEIMIASKFKYLHRRGVIVLVFTSKAADTAWATVAQSGQISVVGKRIISSALQSSATY
jgi:hypothetical protein